VVNPASTLAAPLANAVPITITLPQANGSWIGPGATVTAQTDVQGPLPSDTQWNYQVRLGSDETPVWEEFVFQNVNPNSNVIMVKDPRKSTTRTHEQPTEGQQVSVTVELQTSSGIVDSGTTTATWHATTGLGVQSFLQPQTQAAGGFNDQDRALLTATERRTQTLGEPTDLVVTQPSGQTVVTLENIFSRQTLDQLTLDELTAGPTGDPVRAQLALWFFGVIVRVSTIPEDMVPKTPDGQWYFPDLAVLRIFRGVDLEYRRGIHTPTFMQENPWQWGWGFLNVTQILGVPPETTVAVDWRLGVEGQVFLQRLP